jgi:hypothetical protein
MRMFSGLSYFTDPRLVYDRVLRHNDDAGDFVRYILDNPVRAGLVEDPNAYPFIGGSALHLAADKRVTNHGRG